MKRKFSVKDREKFRILQLTDVQYDSDIDEKSIAVKDAVIALTNPDFIVLTGDNVGGEFLRLKKKKAYSVLNQIKDYFDAKKIPWTTCFGNHDGFWTKNAKIKMLDIFSQSKYYVGGKNTVEGEDSFESGEDDTYTNYFFSVFDENERKFFGILLMDSATAVITRHKGLCDSQLDFYKKISMENKDLPIAMFMHLPPERMQDAYDRRMNKDIVKEYAGDVENPQKGKIYYPRKDAVQNAKLTKLLGEYKNVKGIFVGHDHIANFAANYKLTKDYNLIMAYGRLSSYGMKAWKYSPFSQKQRRKYNQFDRGGRVVDLYRDGNLITHEALYLDDTKTCMVKNEMSLK